MIKPFLFLFLFENVLSASQIFPVQNYFQKRTIQFITNFYDLSPSSYQLRIFHEIVSFHQLNPRVLDNLPHWKVALSRYNPQSAGITKRYPLYSHYDPEVVTFLLPKTRKTESNQEFIRTRNFINSILAGIILSSENPSHIFIQLDYWIPDFKEISFPGTTLTSKFIILIENKPLLLICNTCPLPYILIPKFLSISEIAPLWEKYNWDFSSVIVSPTEILLIDTFLDQYKCTLVLGLYKYPQYACVFATLGGHYNISISASSHSSFNSDGSLRMKMIVMGTPRFGYLALQDFIENFLARRKSKLSWYIYGTHYLPFVYVVLTENAHMTFETLVMPFDVATWLISVASFGGVMIILMFVGKVKKNTDSQPVRDKFLWSISTVLDQADGDFTKFIFPNRCGILMIFIGIWYCFIFFLGNFYKGALFSWMTMGISVPVPEGLSNLITGTDWGVFTSSVIYLSDEGMRADSLLLRGMIPDLMNSSVVQMPEFLRDLATRGKLLLGETFDIGRNISKRVQIFRDIPVNIH